VSLFPPTQTRGPLVDPFSLCCRNVHNTSKFGEDLLSPPSSVLTSKLTSFAQKTFRCPILLFFRSPCPFSWHPPVTSSDLPQPPFVSFFQAEARRPYFIQGAVSLYTPFPFFSYATYPPGLFLLPDSYHSLAWHNPMPSALAFSLETFRLHLFNGWPSWPPPSPFFCLKFRFAVTVMKVVADLERNLAFFLLSCLPLD